MIQLPSNPEEMRRLEVLRQYAVLDTLPEEALDDLTALAAQICGVPIALISLVDERRQWFKSKVGQETTETTRDVSFCAHALQLRELLIVPDAKQDERFAHNPLVTGEPGIRFYAGAPLISPENTALGTLCVIDRVPRTLTQAQEQALRVLARQVMTHLELRRQTQQLVTSEHLLRTIFDSEPECLKVLGSDGSLHMINRAGLAMIEADSLEQVAGQCVYPLIVPEHRAKVEALTNRVFRGESGGVEFQIVGLKGTPRWFETRAAPLRNDQGEVTALLGITRDITEAKKTEEQLLWKTTFFEAQVNSALDGILVVNGEGKKILQNQQMIDLWNIPQEIAEDDDHLRRFEWITGQLRNPRRYAEKVVYLYSHPDEVSRDELELKDGRYFDLYSAPVRDKGGKYYGRIWVYRDITERKQAEVERQRVGHQMLLLLESAVEGICGVDTKWQCTFINRAAAEMLGRTQEEAQGRNLHEMAHHHREDGSVYPIEECPIFKAFKKQEWCHVDTEVFWRADGTSFPVEYSSRPIFEGTEVTGAVVTFTNITERKRAEQVLRGQSSHETSRKRKKAYIELSIIFTVAVLVFIIGYRFELFDDMFRYLDTNGNELGVFWDKTAGALIFLCLGLLIFSLRRLKDSHAENASQAQIALALRRLHGEMETRVQQRTADSVKANEAMHAEMNERKRATKLIAEQAAFLDKAQDAILVRDLEGKTLFWNKGAERMYGWDREEVEGRNIVEQLYANPLKFEEVKKLTIDEGEWYGELQHLTKDKREITVEARWTLIRNAEGQPKSLLSINTDITEKKKIEAQFMRAQRMESIGTLAGGIAHDLNNILAPIVMSIDILKLSSTDPQAKSILETIEVSAKRGADIVRQVLSFARGLEGERVEIQPNHLLKDVKSIIKETFPKNIQLQFSVPADTWMILGDPTQIHQILLNLCVNARDAMPDGGTLTIKAENCVLDEQYVAVNLQAKAGRYINISVTDSGTGMSPEILDKIYEPFFTTKEINKGTGLGLSTTMAIVKTHGGIINVYSEPGKGTTFKIYLPAMDVSAKARTDQSGKVNLPRGNGETVLVVDDEASVLTITVQTLQAFGYKTLTAGDGAAAVALYAQHQHEIGVVLTDMAMPIMDGPATIHALLRIDPAVKIIAASGLNAPGVRSKELEVKIRHFLTKPYTAGTLLKTIRSILDET